MRVRGRERSEVSTFCMQFIERRVDSGRDVLGDLKKRKKLLLILRGRLIDLEDDCFVGDG